jgi:hypothetical protein
MPDTNATDRLLNEDGEVVVALANGYTLRSGAEDRISGEYVRLCDPDGYEVMYWHHDEWDADPIMVMGAILNSAAGLLVDGLEHVSYFVESGEGEPLTEPTADRAKALAEAKRLRQRFIAEDTEGTHLVYDFAPEPNESLSVRRNKVGKTLSLLVEGNIHADFERMLPLARRLLLQLGGPHAFAGEIAPDTDTPNTPTTKEPTQ